MTRFMYSICLLLMLACQVANDPGSSQNRSQTDGNNNLNASCTPTLAGKAGAVKILFLGNSLTYTNELPSRVASIARSNNKLVETEMIAKPNYALEDHWIDGCIQTMIKSGYYDYVVVQQGPSSQSDGATSLLEYGGLLQEMCKANDTKLAFFMVWPARVNYHTFPGVITNYTNAANATAAILCPVGQAWKQHMDSTGDYSYYGPDAFHPSEAGTNVAAEIIYKSLFP